MFSQVPSRKKQKYNKGSKDRKKGKQVKTEKIIHNTQQEGAARDAAKREEQRADGNSQKLEEYLKELTSHKKGKVERRTRNAKTKSRVNTSY